MSESRRIHEVKLQREKQLKDSKNLFVESGRVHKIDGMTIVEMRKEPATDFIQYGEARFNQKRTAKGSLQNTSNKKGLFRKLFGRFF